MATYSRHHAHYATPAKTLPITMPSKAPVYHNPTSRVSISPPEYSDTSSSRHSSSGGSYSVSSRGSDRSSTGGSRSGRSDYDKYDVSGGSRHGASARGRVEADPVEMLTERMDRVSDFTKMDRSLARQTQDSGRLNAAQTELAELQAMAQRRLKTTRVNFAQGVEDAKEARRDLDYCKAKTASMKSRAEGRYPAEYTKTKSRSRHAA